MTLDSEALAAGQSWVLIKSLTEEVRLKHTPIDSVREVIDYALLLLSPGYTTGRPVYCFWSRHIMNISVCGSVCGCVACSVRLLTWSDFLQIKTKMFLNSPSIVLPNPLNIYYTCLHGSRQVAITRPASTTVTLSSLGLQRSSPTSCNEC